ncbi:MULTISPECIES: hypothetical protein [Sphingobium]|uniref:hypothetical protein n=1 Tax=Sphingobium TaxID=165695 RepID=UPI00159BFFAE|nr:hypothetical protein [Sphingobium sp. 15-1]
MDDADVASPLPPFGMESRRRATGMHSILATGCRRAKNASPREPTTGGFVSLPFGFFEIFGFL